MQKKVIVQINGSQKYQEGHEVQQELIVDGTYYERNGGYYVVYKDCNEENADVSDITTFLSVKDGVVKLQRQGAVDNKQEFKRGVLNKSVYATRFGKMWLSVKPHLVECDLTAQGGRISLEYDLFVDDIWVSYNALWVSIKEDFPG